MKFKEVRGGQRVCLTVARCVKKVGYEWDWEAARQEIAVESGHDPKSLFNELDILHHPSLETFRRELPRVAEGIREALSSEGARRLLGRIRMEVAYSFVRDRMRSKIREGAERQIHFGTVEGEHWEGPWEVVGTRRAVTGVYRPASRGWEENDYEPPDLVDRRHHTLLLVRRSVRFWERTVLLKADTVEWGLVEPALAIMKDGEDSPSSI
jgi:hypothetical protein